MQRLTVVGAGWLSRRLSHWDDRGYNELQDVRGEKVRLFGASMQASIHKGMPLTSSVDYWLYKSNGESISGLFAPERYPGGFAWLAQGEFTMLGQTLKDPDASGSTVNQLGKAGDVNVRMKLDRIRLRLDVSYRNLAVRRVQPARAQRDPFRRAFSAPGRSRSRSRGWCRSGSGSS
jgi:hypothetical protein